jgi:hypothetical protein
MLDFTVEEVTKQEYETNEEEAAREILNQPKELKGHE